MKIEKYISQQISSITTSLIKTSFQVGFNFPSEKDGVVVWSGFKNISFALKNQPYEELYKECLKESAYNFILIDGAIIQMMYECSGNRIIKHRLAFYPNPNLERFQDSPQDYEDTYYGNQLFADIFERKVVVFPMRVDFDADKKKYIEHDHSYVHATLGNYSNCRVPVSKPLSPNKFILFILRSFYFDRFKEYYTNDDFACSYSGEEYLSIAEKAFIHFNH